MESASAITTRHCWTIACRAVPGVSSPVGVIGRVFDSEAGNGSVAIIGGCGVTKRQIKGFTRWCGNGVGRVGFAFRDRIVVGDGNGVVVIESGHRGVGVESPTGEGAGIDDAGAVVFDRGSAGRGFAIRSRVGGYATNKSLLGQCRLKLEGFTAFQNGVLLAGNIYTYKYFAVGIKCRQRFVGIIDNPVKAIPDLDRWCSQSVGGTSDILQQHSLPGIAANGEHRSIRRLINCGAVDRYSTVIIQGWRGRIGRTAGYCSRIVAATAVIINVGSTVDGIGLTDTGYREEIGFLPFKNSVVDERCTHQQAATG